MSHLVPLSPRDEPAPDFLMEGLAAQTRLIRRAIPTLPAHITRLAIQLEHELETAAALASADELLSSADLP